eukprot:CAMPEP_0178445972 /NCGR_PEP_ID=MMETSP0689_2-20121128/40507_1 /TAXON_ID=160604 /ORGANISM="Amphidinium massartii, Strain CS-259" /LENGTH=41 /DNA_ID= /DNA_START= /DNA_END= /DNA_ORIENTATION=
MCDKNCHTACAHEELQRNLGGGPASNAPKRTPKACRPRNLP